MPIVNENPIITNVKKKKLNRTRSVTFNDESTLDSLYDDHHRNQRGSFIAKNPKKKLKPIIK